MGASVVGNPAAVVMTSSPGRRRRSPSLGEVSAASATRLALEPELTSNACERPKYCGEFGFEPVGVAGPR